jgi:hypothetical protein
MSTREMVRCHELKTSSCHDNYTMLAFGNAAVKVVDSSIDCASPG